MRKIAYALLLSHVIIFTSAYGVDTFQQAAAHDNIVALQEYLAEGVDINEPTINGSFTALHMAAGADREQAVKLLLDNGADVNAKSAVGLTPLHVAALEGYVKIVDLLLAQGADVNAPDDNGLTPLHIAAQYGHVKVVESLLTNGADINAKTDFRGLTPLHWVAFWGYTEAVNTLLEYGADVNAEDNRGDTPLTWAEAHDHYAMARLLVVKGGKGRPRRFTSSTAF